jgi:hypothetical protein
MVIHEGWYKGANRTDLLPRNPPCECMQVDLILDRID